MPLHFLHKDQNIDKYGYIYIYIYIYIKLNFKEKIIKKKKVMVILSKINKRMTKKI